MKNIGFLNFRVTEEQEKKGLDLTIHGCHINRSTLKIKEKSNINQYHNINKNENSKLLN